MDTFDGFPPVRQHFAEKANACIPELQTVEQQPLGLVKAEEDTSALLGWKAVPDGPVESMKVLDAGDSIIVDFGTSLKDSCETRREMLRINMWSQNGILDVQVAAV